jgi:hypothetical protein
MGEFPSKVIKRDDPEIKITASRYGGSVIVVVKTPYGITGRDASLYLTPQSARTLSDVLRQMAKEKP